MFVEMVVVMNGFCVVRMTPPRDLSRGDDFGQVRQELGRREGNVHVVDPQPDHGEVRRVALDAVERAVAGRGSRHGPAGRTCPRHPHVSDVEHLGHDEVSSTPRITATSDRMDVETCVIRVTTSLATVEVPVSALTVVSAPPLKFTLNWNVTTDVK